MPDRESLTRAAERLWRRRLRVGPSAMPDEGEPPLRSELLPLAQLSELARARAGSLQASVTRGTDRLLRRLRENREQIRRAHAAAVAAARRNARVAPAEEWFLDNYYVLDEQIDLSIRHLPPGYSRELPRLRAGPLEGFPRVYDLALTLVAHTDGRVDIENLLPFVRAFQRVHPLSLGELWALPIMVRLTLIENLRRVAQRVTWRRSHRDHAHEWVQRFLRTAQTEPRDLILELADFVRARPPHAAPFVAELAAGIEGVHPALGLVIDWLEQDLVEHGLNIATVRQAESQDQAADQVSVANSIGSLRGMAGIDWHAFVEEMSVTETVLRTDPAGVYGKMDFQSRDAYRHVVEELAKGSREEESRVAAEAVRLAAGRSADPDGGRERHIGFFLLDEGRPELERALRYRPRLRDCPGRWLLRHPATGYAGLAVLGTVLPAIPLLFWLRPFLIHDPAGGVALAVATLLALTRIGISLANDIVSALVPPRGLPRLDFAKGIPDTCRTAVAVPALLGSEESTDRLLERLELRFLMNRQSNLFFVLLTDFTDSAQACSQADQDLLERVSEGVRRLNLRYVGAARFFLLHRPREWNPSERTWMGAERKRGKIEAFNRLVRHGETKPFSAVEGNFHDLRDVRYVISLDEDTQLPPETAWQLVATAAHPLNRPVFDPRTRTVVAGYGLLQPRVTVSLDSARRSRYARLCAGEVGIDPYTRQVSNVYHDLLGQAAYVGKGIYDVAAFDDAMEGRFPVNRILSHDLIEGCHARCGFVNNVELIEDHPATVAADMQRRHRWVRGDWQIVRWLLPRVPTTGGRGAGNPIGGLGRWMILDNLRRSLVPAAWLAALLAGGLAGTDRLYLIGLLVFFFLPDAMRSLTGIFRTRGAGNWSTHLARLAEREGRVWGLAWLDLTLLPYTALIFLHAILITCWRLISRRHLLQWVSAAVCENPRHHDLPAALRVTSVPTVLTAAATVLLIRAATPAAVVIAPLSAWWTALPLLVWLLAQPRTVARIATTPEQVALMRHLAWRTWLYFETFMNEDHHHLPPDNIQEIPRLTVAHRTSPTNIGLGLLANLCACDLGYISVGRLVSRTAATFETLDRLPRYRGHFYNWYDTRTLAPLHPIYISSVDSGNLSGHLATLSGGLRELANQTVLPPRWRDGLLDMLEAAATAPGAGDLSKLRPRLRALQAAPASLPEWQRALREILNDLARLAPEGAVMEADSVRRQCQDLLEELVRFAPWLDLSRADRAHDLRLVAEDPELQAALARPGTPSELAALPARLAPMLDRLTAQDEPAAARLREQATLARERALERLEALADLTARAEAFSQMELDFLYDPSRKLLAIGYTLEQHHRDSNFYDLLASEARLCSFLGVARGQLPVEHWFQLSRAVAPVRGGPPVLLSWSGSLFEYLMPLLVMPAPPDTLLAATCEGAVLSQIRHGRRRNVPWGVSESCFSRIDASQTYQYRAFGVPELGLKRGLADDLVIAPYATALALTVAPEAAARNLRTLQDAGFTGRYGLYEAVDYTRNRLPPDTRYEIVRAFMAHHGGMSLVALTQALLGRIMERRFLSHPSLRACEVLLHERVPPRGLARPRIHVEGTEHEPATEPPPPPRAFTDPDTAVPEVHLLANARLATGVTHTGGGWCRWNGLDVTRWREDATRDCWGTFLYIRDTDTGSFWSPTPQPAGARIERYHAHFEPGVAEFEAVHDRIGMHLRVAVSPEDDIELRRLTLNNESGRRRSLDITTYAELVLMEGRAEASHPAFHNLFMQTEPLAPHRDTLLGTRRRRAAAESPPWCFHSLLVRGDAAETVPPSFESDRAVFIGRGRSPANPQALLTPGPLSNSSGCVLDPVVAVRRHVEIPPGETLVLDAVSGVAATREETVRLAEKYRDHHFVERVFELAWTDHQVLLNHLHAGEADVQLFETLAGSIVYANARFRSVPSVLARNRRSQSGLWSYGLSGDLPIVLLRIGDHAGLHLVRQLIQAHAFWRHKGLRVDLVVWAEAYSGYRQNLLDAVRGAVHASTESKLLDQPGGIFVQNLDKIPEDDQVLLQAVARVTLSDRAGDLHEQVARRVRARPRPASGQLLAARPGVRLLPEPSPQSRDLRLFNGTGGFTPDGREYAIVLRPDKHTPLPWSNVLANPTFGCVLTESGGGYTWSGNAHEARLTPWHNDPIEDPVGEAWYIRDEETGLFWSALPQPAPSPSAYVCRHGLGYSVFEHTQSGIVAETWIYVVVDAPVKIVSLRLRNLTDRPRPLSLAGYVEWVLGETRDRHAMHVATRLDGATRAIFAWNAFQIDSPGRVAFFQCSASTRTQTGDRTEFIGRNGSLAAPAALRRTRLSNRVGAGLDPCAAMLVPLELPPGTGAEVVFVLGTAESEEQARALLNRLAGPSRARQALNDVWEFWKRQLGGVYLESPDPSVDFLVNHWLLYQVLASRFWGRSGYYQSGGAYGFRDQLQDSLAMLWECPWHTREHLLLCAAHQYWEGDVQQWWHPPTGRGVRTRISDAALWLPYAVCRYVEATEDRGVLDDAAPFLEGRPLGPDEESYYDRPTTSNSRASLYEHCVRAIRLSLRMGSHGLPLMLAGDWNDGLNRVGRHGRGESVWLAFFLHDVLARFAHVATGRADTAFANTCLEAAERLAADIARHAWDGQWYLRAFFDDGTPLGSSQNPECRIDALPQSWAALTHVGDPARNRQALQALRERLVDDKLALIKLFAPPFDAAPWDPGYIRGYAPGVRENGGQYTHAAVWAVLAFAEAGEVETAWQLFNLINPIRHADTPERAALYRVEPYIVAADVYTAKGHEGRGGWTWYTGSAGWMYQLLVGKFLGLQRQGDRLRLAPLLPPDWPQCTLHFRHRETFYHILIVRLIPASNRVTRVLCDDAELPEQTIALIDDRHDHSVRVELG